MKPIVLKMKAFCSYANLTIVDFNKLNSGLYLITGDTGAGKTSIFDAMVYALYGESSGSFRDGSMLHSDFVSKSEDTIVSLEFIHLNKKYYVERKIHFPKSRNGNYGEAKQLAILKEEDGRTTELSSKVTTRICEIIGLDANQFKQIIILAQGEFQKFLTSKSDERSIILGKLFDNSPFIRFQSRLKAASNAIKNQILENEKIISIKMDDFKIPCGDNPLLYAMANPDLIINIENLLNKENKQLELINQSLKDILIKRSEVDAIKAQAIDRNKALDNLKDIEIKYNNLLLQKNDKDILLNKLNIVEKAHNNVTPLKNIYNDLLIRLNNNEKELLNNNELLNNIKLEKDNIDKEYLLINELKDNNIKLSTYLNELYKQLDIFKPYNECKKSYDQKYQIKNKLDDNILKAKKEKALLDKNKELIENNIKNIKIEIDKFLVRKENADVAIDRYNQLVKKDGLIDKINIINDETKLLVKLKIKELQLNEELRQTKLRYDQLYDAFIKAQAAILAKELKIKLQTLDEVECPVCHSHLLKNDISKLFVSDEIITKDKVDQAKNDYDILEKSYNNLFTTIKTKEEKINVLKQNIVVITKQMALDINNYDDLNENYINNIKDNLLNNKDKAIIELNKSENAKLELSEQENLLNNILIKQQNNNVYLENSNNELSDINISLAKLETKLNSLLISLDGHTEKEINTKISTVLQDINNNEQKIEMIINKKNLIDEKFSKINGSINILNKTHDNLIEECKNSLINYQNALKDNGFKAEKDYEEVILMISENVLDWINKTRNELQIYRENLNSLNNYLQAERLKCQNYIYVNLNDIELQLMEVEKKHVQISFERDELNKLLTNHQSILSFIKDKYEEINKIKPASDRLVKLSNLANASISSEGGKITFDRYVMGNAFQEILIAANVHLQVMASGQFELIHQTKGVQASSHAGLGIEVLDVFTGEKRKPESLSGGEKFQVSLSLALGLSDIVQNHAGGKKIDTMYIDEGFGTLDEAILDKAIQVLKSIAGKTRQIGIISHVESLEESISQKIVVKKTNRGSTLEII